MIKVLLGMGSNINPEHHLAKAGQAICQRFSQTQFSAVYQSKAVGMQGDDFLNACCTFESDLLQGDLLIWLKALEDNHKRDRSRGSWKPRTLDLDVLMLDATIVDDDLYRYAHIFVPASELMQLQRLKSETFAAVTKVNLKL